MEKKIGLIILVGGIITIIMFNVLRNDKKDYLIFSDSISILESENFNALFYNELKSEISSINESYVINNLNIRNLYDLIIINEDLDSEDLTIKQLINQAEIITISIGTDELVSYENINVYLYYMDLVLNEISKINDFEIYLIGLYSSELNLKNVNFALKNLCSKYDFYFVDIENSLNSDEKDDFYLESEASQLLISNELLNAYNKVNNT